MNDQASTNKCGTCRWWVRNPGEGVRSGDCYLNPPTMTPGGQKVPRPVMRENEIACSHHGERPEGEEALVRKKFEPTKPTHEPVAQPQAAPEPTTTSKTISKNENLQSEEKQTAGRVGKHGKRP